MHDRALSWPGTDTSIKKETGGYTNFMDANLPSYRVDNVIHPGIFIEHFIMAEIFHSSDKIKPIFILF